VSRLRVENRSSGGRDSDRSNPAKQHGLYAAKTMVFPASSGHVFVQFEAAFRFDRAAQFPCPTFGAVRRRSSVETRALGWLKASKMCPIIPAISGVAPIPFMRERLDASRLRSLALAAVAALTRPARSQRFLQLSKRRQSAISFGAHQR
jgi:hypothetical protein